MFTKYCSCLHQMVQPPQASSCLFIVFAINKLYLVKNTIIVLWFQWQGHSVVDIAAMGYGQTQMCFTHVRTHGSHEGCIGLMPNNASVHILTSQSDELY